MNVPYPKFFNGGSDLDIDFAFIEFRCYLQKRVLNRSKGPAVWALRAQTDKREYALEMKSVLEVYVT